MSGCYDAACRIHAKQVADPRYHVQTVALFEALFEATLKKLSASLEALCLKVPEPAPAAAAPKTNLGKTADEYFEMDSVLDVLPSADDEIGDGYGAASDVEYDDRDKYGPPDGAEYDPRYDPGEPDEYGVDAQFAEYDAYYRRREDLRREDLRREAEE